VLCRENKLYAGTHRAVIGEFVFRIQPVKGLEIEELHENSRNNTEFTDRVLTQNPAPTILADSGTQTYPPNPIQLDDHGSQADLSKVTDSAPAHTSTSDLLAPTQLLLIQAPQTCQPVLTPYPPS
jgi:hypothetical protein